MPDTDNGDSGPPADIDADLPAHVEATLAEFLRQATRSIEHADPTVVPAAETLSEFVLGGGKRLRPTFAWWGWRGAGGEQAGERAAGALQIAASLELIQACALIHDDVLDSSDSRRCAPTVHVSYAQNHRWNGWLGSSERFGLAAAVLIGDLALAWADDMFSGAPLPADVLGAARPAWRAMRTEVLAGQYLDVHTQAIGDTSADAALRIDRLKTAAYTVQRPLHLGAALAGAGPATVDALLAFGGDLGVAFQLRDDLLGVFGDPTVTGKPAGDDLREGKRTLLLALGLQFADDQRRRDAADEIRAAVGNAALDAGDVDRVRDLLTELGAVAELEQRIETLTESALGALARAALADPAPARLAALAAQATQRSS